MHLLWTIIIGFVAGVIAKFIYPGNKYEPTGFILTTVLGIVGAVVAQGRRRRWLHRRNRWRDHYPGDMGVPRTSFREAQLNTHI
jgi:uncharacterized membrane protein YeaQ/YmgE (transglycosylase-associated protein family)